MLIIKTTQPFTVGTGVVIALAPIDACRRLHRLTAFEIDPLAGYPEHRGYTANEVQDFKPNTVIGIDASHLNPKKGGYIELGGVAAQPNPSLTVNEPPSEPLALNPPTVQTLEGLIEQIKNSDGVSVDLIQQEEQARVRPRKTILDACDARLNKLTAPADDDVEDDLQTL